MNATRRDLLFEKSYCEYRLNRLSEAIATIKGADENDLRIQELLGQIVILYSDLCLISLFGYFVAAALQAGAVRGGAREVQVPDAQHSRTTIRWFHGRRLTLPIVECLRGRARR